MIKKDLAVSNLEKILAKDLDPVMFRKAIMKSNGGVEITAHEAEKMQAAIDSDSKANKIGTAFECIGETAYVENTDIDPLIQNGVNISAGSYIGKSGRLFKTIRIPKGIFSGIREEKTNAVIYLVQLSNFLWRVLMPYTRPPGMFTTVVLAYMKSLAGVPDEYSMSSKDVMTIIQGMIASYPGLVNAYVYSTAMKKQENKELAALKSVAKDTRNEIQEVLNKAFNDPASASIMFGQLLRHVEKFAEPFKELVKKNQMDEFINKVAGATTTERKTISTSGMKRFTFAGYQKPKQYSYGDPVLPAGAEAVVGLRIGAKGKLVGKKEASIRRSQIGLEDIPQRFKLRKKGEEGEIEEEEELKQQPRRKRKPGSLLTAGALAALPGPARKEEKAQAEISEAPTGQQAKPME